MTVTTALFDAARDGRLSDLQTELRKGECNINAADSVRYEKYMQIRIMYNQIIFFTIYHTIYYSYFIE